MKPENVMRKARMMNFKPNFFNMNFISFEAINPIDETNKISENWKIF